jgi:hypothetical protein
MRMPRLDMPAGAPFGDVMNQPDHGTERRRAQYKLSSS